MSKPFGRGAKNSNNISISIIYYRKRTTLARGPLLFDIRCGPGAMPPAPLIGGGLGDEFNYKYILCIV